MFWDMNLKFVLPIIYINFDIQTKFEVNQTQILSPKNSINMYKVHIYFDSEKCRRSRLFGEWHLGKMWFWDMAILVIFGNMMANLGLIDFKLGLYIKVKLQSI